MDWNYFPGIYLTSYSKDRPYSTEAVKTIKEIAKEANVSSGTVDRVIHNRPGVSKKTKLRIQHLLEKYDYEKNFMASTLARGRRYTIAVIVPSSENEKGFWYEVNQGLKNAIFSIKRYGVATKCFYFKKLEIESYKQVLQEVLQSRVDGVVLAPFYYKASTEFARKLDERNIPYLFFNIDIESMQNLCFIGQDSYHGGLTAGKLLKFSLKPRDHIIVVRELLNLDKHHSYDLRIKGFLDYIHAGNGSIKTKEIYLDSFTKANVESLLSKELSDNPLIRGIFVPSSSSHFVAEYLDKSNRSHMHLVGFDALEKSLKYLENGTIDFLIDQDPFEQANLGIKVLFEYLLLRKIPKRLYSSPINIVTRENAQYFRKLSEVELV